MGLAGGAIAAVLFVLVGWGSLAEIASARRRLGRRIALVAGWMVFALALGLAMVGNLSFVLALVATVALLSLTVLVGSAVLGRRGRRLTVFAARWTAGSAKAADARFWDRRAERRERNAEPRAQDAPIRAAKEAARRKRDDAGRAEHPASGGGSWLSSGNWLWSERDEPSTPAKAKPFPCRYCDNSYDSKAELEDHYRDAYQWELDTSWGCINSRHGQKGG